MTSWWTPGVKGLKSILSAKPVYIYQKITLSRLRLFRVNFFGRTIKFITIKNDNEEIGEI